VSRCAAATWRTLVREGGLKPDAAVDAMVQAICGDRNAD
jgi:hypothetical protein